VGSVYASHNLKQQGGQHEALCPVVTATLASVAVVGFVVSPAFGGPGFLTAKKARKIFVTKKLARKYLTRASAASTYVTGSDAASTFLSQSEAQGKYVGKSEADEKYVGKSEADEKYLPASAETILQVPPVAWQTSNSSSSTEYFANATRLERGSAGETSFNAGIPLPSVLQGRPVKVTGMELCYEATFGATLSAVYLYFEGAPGVTDETDRTDNACRTYEPEAPVSPGGFVQIQVLGSYSGAAYITVSHLELRLID
jgi:hypothetical protein